MEELKRAIENHGDRITALEIKDARSEERGRALHKRFDQLDNDINGIKGYFKWAFLIVAGIALKQVVEWYSAGGLTLGN